MDSAEVRQLSLTLFMEIKPTCVQISQLSLKPAETFKSVSTELIHGLRKLTELLRKHHESHSSRLYSLSTKLADYVFFPLSNLLKHPSLDPQVVRYILDIITFLIKYSWSHNIEEQLLDQLCPLVIFLSGVQSISNTKLPQVINKEPEFKISAVSCLTELIKCFPRLYFTNEERELKRLSFLGDSTTLLLDVMRSFESPLNQDENEVVTNILDVLQWLYSTRVTAEQTSFVFPGMVSKIVNFSISTRNLHASTIIKVLETLQVLIIKVFDDENLKILISDGSVTSENLHSLQDLMEEEREEDQKIIPIDILIDDAIKSHRTKLWVRATSKQLKLSLISLFKYLILNPSMRSKVAINILVSDAIFAFINAISEKCLQSLFNEFIQSSFDILSALIFVITSHLPHVLELDLYKQASRVYLQFDHKRLELLLKQLLVKSTFLVHNQFPSVLNLLNEEKVGVCTVAIKLHLYMLQALVDITESGQDSLALLKKNVLHTFKFQISAKDVSGKTHQKASKDQFLRFISGDTSQDKGNTLDDIELPPHINAKSLAKLKKEERTLKSVQGSSNLRRLISDWNEDYQKKEITLFGNVFNKSTEDCLKSLISFIGRQSQNDLETLVNMVCAIERTSEDTDHAILEQSVSLWTANHLYSSSAMPAKLIQDFDVNDFLTIHDELSKDDGIEETGYIILERALDLITQAKRKVTESSGALNDKQTTIYHMAYVTALESIEILSFRLSKEDFQADFLMEYLFLLLEALTFPADSVAHLQARKTLDSIVHNYYDGSLNNLIVDNADYLIDSLSMSLSVASGLMPSLPGILLVVLKISGVQLLQSNQLNDILSEIFIVIDSYHGYSILVENFFLVFEVIVEITNEIYSSVISDEAKITQDANTSRYKPWGMSTRQQMLNLIDDNEKLVDTFDDYDLSKEYFKRKPGVPFGEQDGDSDDEENEEGDEPYHSQPGTDEWKSPIPKSIYLLIQQIFTYGLQFLSHPSDKLKIQVLKTLQKAYPLMSTNYSVLMPLLAQYWPMILVLTSGVLTTSEYESTKSLQHLIEPSLQLTMNIIKEDAKHEAFMSKRFVDMWDFWKKKCSAFHLLKKQSSKVQLVSTNVMPPTTSLLYARTLVTGLNTYGKIIPDLTAIEIGEACITMGLPKDTNLNRDVEALFWVIKNQRT